MTRKEILLCHSFHGCLWREQFIELFLLAANLVALLFPNSFGFQVICVKNTRKSKTQTLAGFLNYLYVQLYTEADLFLLYLTYRLDLIYSFLTHVPYSRTGGKIIFLSVRVAKLLGCQSLFLMRRVSLRLEATQRKVEVSDGQN